MLQDIVDDALVQGIRVIVHAWCFRWQELAKEGPGICSLSRRGCQATSASALLVI